MIEADSMRETLRHIRRVQSLLREVVDRLFRRAIEHDESKLCEPESSIFAEYTSQLNGLTYGSEEYSRCLDEMQVAIKHHYQVNRHHPEHWPRGIEDMSLIDLIEMLCDWKAATERHADGDLDKSLEVNRKRFNYSETIESILRNTVRELWPSHRERWHCFGCGNGGAEGNFCEMCGAGKRDYEGGNP